MDFHFARLGRIQRQQLCERHLQLHPRSRVVSLPKALKSFVCCLRIEVMKTWKVDSLLNRAGTRVALTILLLSFGSIAIAADLASERAGRTAIDRVYYNHRLGEKPLFEQVL